MQGRAGGACTQRLKGVVSADLKTVSWPDGTTWERNLPPTAAGPARTLAEIEAAWEALVKARAANARADNGSTREAVRAAITALAGGYRGGRTKADGNNPAGLRHGEGVQLYEDGTWYSGNWCKGARHGYGHYHDTSGAEYVVKNLTGGKPCLATCST